jgi:hypothetical protein
MQQKLLAQIATALESRVEISLSELIKIYPIDGGIDEEVKDSIEVANVLQGSQMKTTMPRIVFLRQAYLSGTER